MKKIVLLASLLLALAGLIPLAAQEGASSRPEGTFAVTVSLERVYAYRKGYIVKYRKGPSQIVDAYLPEEWFHGTQTKGDVVLMGSGANWPHLTVFYKDGVFDHVRLYVRKNRGHESWGTVPLGVDIDDRFEDTEDFRLQF